MTSKKSNSKKRSRKWNPFSLHRFIIVSVFFIAVFFIVVRGAAPVKYDLKVDDICPVQILAPRDIVDKLTTERLQKEAEDKVEPQYYEDEYATKESQDRIYEFLSDIQYVRRLPDLDEQEKMERLKSISSIKLTDEMIAACIQMSDNQMSQFQIAVLNIHSQIMGNGVEQDALYEAISSARTSVEKLDLSQELKDLGYIVLANVIQPNKKFDSEKTLQLKEEARNSVEVKQYKKGEKIIGNGERVRPEHLAMLDELGLIKHEQNTVDYQFIVGIFFIILVLFLIIFGYLYYFNPKILNDRSDLILVGLIFVSILIIPLLTKSIPAYILPVSAAAMLIAILLDTKLAILINLAVSVLIGLMVKGDTNFVCITLLSGTFAAFAVTKTYQRNRLVISGLVISLVNALLMISFGLIGANELRTVIYESRHGIFNGLLSIVITIGILPFLETAFNIITPFKLLELSNPNQPILKRLLLEAPGTYHHSLMVGNLAEAATEAIGGNGLLARVAAYYHDIGKLKRPYFFMENQLNENPHDRMAAQLSKQIIVSHTKDGEELAKSNKIPLAIRDIIKQHHGTTLVSYFYHKAKNNEHMDTVNPDDFRYDGPKPQTKEAAVVMLADSVEAAVRAMPERTVEKTENMVRKIIKEKLDDGQLDMCDLTMRELDIVAKEFLKVLSGFFHERIEYPDISEKKDESTKTVQENMQERI
ncbi:MAG: HDIG domain-containing protein [Clostridiaceae bacterium]|nr:HDIG domain-containing protein [Clostridiaceae bacterium]